MDTAKLGAEVGDAAVALLVTAVSALAAAPPSQDATEWDTALAHVLDVLSTTLVRADTGAPSDADWRRFVRAGGETICFKLLTSHGAYENTFALCTRATLDIAEVASRGMMVRQPSSSMVRPGCSGRARPCAHAADAHVAAAGARLVQRLVASGTQVAACLPLHEALVATQCALPMITDFQIDQADTDHALSALALAVRAMLSGDSATAVIRGGAPVRCLPLARERCAAVRATEAAIELLAALPADEVIIECGLARTALETPRTSSAFLDLRRTVRHRGTCAALMKGCSALLIAWCQPSLLSARASCLGLRRC